MLPTYGGMEPFEAGVVCQETRDQGGSSVLTPIHDLKGSSMDPNISMFTNNAQVTENIISLETMEVLQKILWEID